MRLASYASVRWLRDRPLPRGIAPMGARICHPFTVPGVCVRGRAARTVWPSGLRRWLQAPVRKGVGSNPTAVTFGNVVAILSRNHKRLNAHPQASAQRGPKAVGFQHQVPPSQICCFMWNSRKGRPGAWKLQMPARMHAHSFYHRHPCITPRPGIEPGSSA